MEVTARGKMLSGTRSQRRKVGVRAMERAIMAPPPNRVMEAAVWMTLFTFWRSPLPKALAVTTPTPTLRPVKRPSIQVISRLPAPTAAEASFPSSLPTNIRSTVL